VVPSPAAPKTPIRLRDAAEETETEAKMSYEAMGALHAWVVRAWARGQRADRQRAGRQRAGRQRACAQEAGRQRARGQSGQGTVEYVGLILLVAVILAGVVKASGSFSDQGIADAVVKKLKAAIDGVGR
jgi:hypothetical protein